MTVTIYHNPACGTSRNTLEMIRQSGEDPTVIEYLKTPPSRERLVQLISAMGISPRQLFREKGTPFHELDLGNDKWADDQLVDFMMQHPILINRPIVETPKGTKLCRPSEAVFSLLDKPLDRFVKEDGEVVLSSETPRN
jgi:arsenate reductase